MSTPTVPKSHRWPEPLNKYLLVSHLFFLMYLAPVVILLLFYSVKTFSEYSYRSAWKESVVRVSDTPESCPTTFTTQHYFSLENGRRHLFCLSKTKQIEGLRVSYDPLNPNRFRIKSNSPLGLSFWNIAFLPFLLLLSSYAVIRWPFVLSKLAKRWASSKGYTAFAVYAAPPGTHPLGFFGDFGTQGTIRILMIDSEGNEESAFVRFRTKLGFVNRVEYMLASSQNEEVQKEDLPRR